MTDADLDFIRRILSVAECGKPDFPYSEVYVYADDNRFDPPRRQVTYSIGFTESGNLKTVLEHYIKAGGLLAKDLKPFLAGLGDKSRGSLAGNKLFISLLVTAGKEPCMAQVQREEFDRMYLSRAINWGEEHGFSLNLSFLVIADSYLHSGSMLGFLMAKFPEKKPIDGGDEKTWIRSYLEVRHQWLKKHSNKILHKTVYRADCYMREATKGNWDLSGSPIVMHGTSVHRLV
jgi:chitosanase